MYTSLPRLDMASVFYDRRQLAHTTTAQSAGASTYRDDALPVNPRLQHAMDTQVLKPTDGTMPNQPQSLTNPICAP
jgi:hypothetical protein